MVYRKYNTSLRQVFMAYYANGTAKDVEIKISFPGFMRRISCAVR